MGSKAAHEGGPERDQIDACVAAALEAARALGLDPDSGSVLACSSNIVVELDPLPVVARVDYRVARLWPDGGRERLRRELELAGWLAARAAPVIAPSDLVPAEVHEHDGRLMTFWERGELPAELPSFEQAAVRLRELHGQLAGYDGPPLGRLVPIHDYIPLMTDELERTGGLDGGRIGTLRASFERLSAAIDHLQLPSRALHGDPHLANLMTGPAGEQLLYIDFEDCCEGPVHWDLASMAGAAPSALERCREAYGIDLDPDETRPFVEARTLQAAAWLALRTRDDPGWRPRRELAFSELEEIERAATDG